VAVARARRGVDGALALLEAAGGDLGRICTGTASVGRLAGTERGDSPHSSLLCRRSCVGELGEPSAGTSAAGTSATGAVSWLGCVVLSARGFDVSVSHTRPGTVEVHEEGYVPAIVEVIDSLSVWKCCRCPGGIGLYWSWRCWMGKF